MQTILIQFFYCARLPHLMNELADDDDDDDDDAATAADYDDDESET